MKRNYVVLNQQDGIARITMDWAERRNALSIEHMKELIGAFTEVGDTDARGILLAANGPVFCAGHDFNDMIGADLAAMRKLLRLCTRMMETIQSVPQPVLAVVQGMATGAGCQLVATCDLAVASLDAQFVTPGGKGGWFCHTPMVAVSRNIGRKRVMEMLLTGRPLPAAQAVEWGLINYAVPAQTLESTARALIMEATQGSPLSKGFGKQAFYAQIDLDQAKAYAYATEMMASTSQVPDAQERMNAFKEKRPPKLLGQVNT